MRDHREMKSISMIFDTFILNCVFHNGFTCNIAENNSSHSELISS